MLNRKYALPLMVAAAAGGPYLLMEENATQSAFRALDQAITTDETSAIPASTSRRIGSPPAGRA